MLDEIRNWLIGNVSWAFVVRLLALSYLTDFVLWPLGKFFSLFKSKAQTTAFLILFPLFIFIILLGLTNASINTPDLRATQTSIAILDTQNHNAKNLVMVALNIINAGSMATITEEFSASIRINNQEFKGKLIAYETPINLRGIVNSADPNVAIEIKPEDDLLQKSDKPIAPGAMEAGYLLMEFGLIDRNVFLNEPKTGLISFMDVKLKKYSVEITFPIGGSFEPTFIPGLKRHYEHF